MWISVEIGMLKNHGIEQPAKLVTKKLVTPRLHSYTAYHEGRL
jgi:hypothetical protein